MNINKIQIQKNLDDWISVGSACSKQSVDNLSWILELPLYRSSLGTLVALILLLINVAQCTLPRPQPSRDVMISTLEIGIGQFPSFGIQNFCRKSYSMQIQMSKEQYQRCLCLTLFVETTGMLVIWFFICILKVQYW